MKRGWGSDIQFSHIAWSQHGRRKAFTASLLQMAHRSLNGISSWVRELIESMSAE